MKYYSNPKFTEHIKDELFVQRLISDKKSDERRQAANAILGIFLGGMVIILTWFVAVFFGG